MSSEQYHVYFGGKVFYFIEPTPRNLKIYSDWATNKGVGGGARRNSRATNRKYIFLPDLIVSSGGTVHKVPLRAGQTLFIPSGWIHAVHTPDDDSLVFGGNFVHRHSLEMQLRINRLEVTMRVGPDFRFPNYQKLMWFAARDFVGECAELLARHEERWEEEKEEKAAYPKKDNHESTDEKATTEEEDDGGRRRGGRQRARILCAAYPPRILKGYAALARELARWSSTSAAKSAIEQRPASMDVAAVANELGSMMKPCAALLGEMKKRGGGGGGVDEKTGNYHPCGRDSSSTIVMKAICARDRAPIRRVRRDQSQ